MVNIANDMSLRFQNYLASLDWTFDSSVHHHTLGCNDSVDMSPAGDDEGCAV